MDNRQTDTHMQRDRQTDRHTQTDRQTWLDRQADTQTIQTDGWSQTNTNAQTDTKIRDRQTDS